MKYPANIQEEELKAKVARDWFAAFDCSRILGKVDFAVCCSPAGKSPSDKFPADLADDAEGEGFDTQKNKRKKEEGKENLLSFSLLSKNKTATSAKSAGNINAGETDFLLWAEAKRGAVADILAPLAQLVITVGKERTFERHLPPKYLAAFDAEKIAFVEYNRVADFFFQNDFNWNVAPSDHTTREFKMVLARLAAQSGHDLVRFAWEADAAELRRWIAANARRAGAKIRITRNNFTTVYTKWVKEVKPSITLSWDAAKKSGIIDADFYLADVLSDRNRTLADKLYVLLKDDHYELGHRRSQIGGWLFQTVDFNDGGAAHAQFWNRYERPPRREYWDYIVERRDLLVPQDVREVKGAFFTPSRWVELSQQYLADALGEDWQSEYTIWDCCAGTGNLLAGLTEPSRVYASTLDAADVKVMHDRIRNGANLLPGNVFQFDFLNDDLFGEKVPATLRAILADAEKRKKLVIYINPPYKEAGNKRAITTVAQGNNPEVATGTACSRRYKPLIGPAANELFALFMIRIHQELQCCKVGHFATLKALCAPNFARFRNVFQSRLKSLFLVPGDSFDNVDGKFPIGFFVWDLDQREPFTAIAAHVYDSKANRLHDKCVFAPHAKGLWMDWVKSIHDKQGERIAYFSTTCSDFQHQNLTFLTLTPSANDFLQHRTHDVTKNNFLEMSVAMAVRLVPKATWLNDRDQFLYPADSWAEDIDFQNDCLIYTLFHGQNRVSAGGADFQKNKRIKETEDEKNSSFSSFLLLSKNNLKESASSAQSAGDFPTPGNHWIPFTETEVGAQASFASHFMSDFLRGKVKRGRGAAVAQGELFAAVSEELTSRRSEESVLSALSAEARAVLDAGRELWRYYHAQPDAVADAALYDIRAHFQGFTNGKMNAGSADAGYTERIGALRTALAALAARIEPRIYAHGFLR